MEPKSIFDDKRLKVITVTSTGLAFAFGVASVAAVRMSQSTGVRLEWHWSILLFVAATLLWNSRLWKAIWHVQHEPTAKAKRRLAFHLAVLVAIGVGSFLYPLLFANTGYRHDALKGLLAALAFLGTLGLLFYRLAKGFNEADAIELRRQARTSEEAMGAQSPQGPAEPSGASTRPSGNPGTSTLAGSPEETHFF